MSTRKFTFVIYNIIFLWCIQIAFSQQSVLVEADSIIQTFRLEEIVVYGEYNFRSPSMITEIKETDIQARNAATVADVLRFDSGLTITNGPKAETETKIRGFPARNVLVLVDGRPINPGYYGKVDLSMLPVDNIAKIKVIKGPASVAYGANGMGGVINVVTKNGLEKPRTVIKTEFGNHQYHQLSINHSRDIGKYNYWLSGYDNYSNGYELSKNFEPISLEDGGLRWNSYYHKAGGDLKIGYQPSKNNLYSVSFGFHWAKKNIPSTIYSWDNPRFRKIPNWQRYSGALSAKWNVGANTELKSILFIDAYNDRLIDYGNNREMLESEIAWDSKLENLTVGASLDYKINAFRQHNLQIGLHAKRDLMNKKPDVHDPWFLHYTFTGNVFLQDNYRPWKKTEIIAGISYNLHNIDIHNSYKDKFCPMISLNQEFPWKLKVHVSFADVIRFPTLHKLYSQSSGNPDLEPEEADKIEIGLERMFLFASPKRYLSAEFACFYNSLKNMIYRASKSYRFKNIEEAEFRGWEVCSKWSLNRYFGGEVSYGRLELLESSVELMEEVPENKYRIFLAGRIGFGTEVNYEFNYFDERKTYVSTIILPEYYIHNLNISQKIGSKLKLRLKISNVTDVDYQEELGYPCPGRRFIAGLTFNL